MRHDEMLLKTAIQALRADEPDAAQVSASATRVAGRLGMDAAGETVGSLEMDKAGFAHLGGPGLQMPPFGTLIKSDEELWKILAWIRSIYKGDPKKKFW